MEVLEEARSHSNGHHLVFPSVSGVVMSDSTMSKLARELDLGMTPHGARASFRNWCAENSIPREVADWDTFEAAGRALVNAPKPHTD